MRSLPTLSLCSGHTTAYLKNSVKVKLPFKTKVNPTADPGAGAALPNNSKGVSAHPISDYHSVPPEQPTADAWTSDIEEGHSKEHAPGSSRGWNGHTSTNDPSQHNHKVRDRHQDRPPSESSQGSPVHWVFFIRFQVFIEETDPQTATPPPHQRLSSATALSSP
ncbi:hypothetical protein F5888DRAFT_1809463 [Russula emetica]|nr:hypothetical protein F5888DRAFT_1809463 [Russula emetica]